MVLIVVAVRDRQVDAFMQPFFSPARGAAVRAFSDEVNRAGSPMNAHPDDYELFELGAFNDADGSFSVLSKPSSLAIAANLIVKR